MQLSRLRACGALLAVLAGTMLFAAPAAAENPFISFLRGDWLRPRPAPPPLSYAPAMPDRGGLSITVNPRRSRTNGSGGGGVVYCVRTCDGRYFPLTGVSSASNDTAVERCNSFCPSSPTKVFVSHDREAGIDAARSKDGAAYSSLDNAYAYRTAINPSCTCNTASTMGVASIDVMDDPTLRAGDLVVTANGVMVFRGDKTLPHSDRDFSAAADDRKLSAATRRQIEALEMASGLAQAPEAAAPGL
ncbi:MAG: hypothetical protein K0R27_2267 [Xanthobacteraceae bacterium]|jgi:hypothetical protein|nr:hypothetical protein [Xanthobacteraceae bacterium]